MPSYCKMIKVQKFKLEIWHNCLWNCMCFTCNFAGSEHVIGSEDKKDQDASKRYIVRSTDVNSWEFSNAAFEIDIFLWEIVSLHLLIAALKCMEGEEVIWFLPVCSVHIEHA